MASPADPSAIAPFPLSAELKTILVCPACKGALTFREPQAAVDCAACRLTFPIVDGLPVMLLEEARPLGSG